MAQGSNTVGQSQPVYLTNADGTDAGGAAQSSQGPAANGAATSGNPVLVAGSDGTNVRTVQTGTTGALTIGTVGTSSVAFVGTNVTDGVASSRVTLATQSFGYVFNGISYDRMRSATNADGQSGVGLLGAGILGQYLTTLTTYTTSQFGTLAMSRRGILLNTDVGGENIATGQVAVATTSTLVVPARLSRQKVTLTPTAATVCYVGANGVTTANGLYVAAGAAITLDTTAAIYAVGASAATISYIEYY